MSPHCILCCVLLIFRCDIVDVATTSLCIVPRFGRHAATLLSFQHRTIINLHLAAEEGAPGGGRADLLLGEGHPVGFMVAPWDGSSSAVKGLKSRNQRPIFLLDAVTPIIPAPDAAFSTSAHLYRYPLGPCARRCLSAYSSPIFVFILVFFYSVTNK